MIFYYRPRSFNELMKTIQPEALLTQKSFNAHRLPTLAAFGYALPVTAKSVAEPRNSNNLQMANSAPRAFFVRCTRTPKENALSGFLSMVACNGKGFALCCVPFVVVFEPVTRYRPQASKLQAVTSSIQQMELSEMIYLFLGISRQTYNPQHRQQFRIEADNFSQANRTVRQQHARDFVLLNIGRINTQAQAFTKNNVNPTACTMGVANA